MNGYRAASVHKKLRHQHRRMLVRKLSESPAFHVNVLGGGIAGLCTTRYLLKYSKDCKVTLIDKEPDLALSSTKPITSYDEQVSSRPHRCIPSRRNGNVLCPSLTVPWTSKSMWKEVAEPAIRGAFGRRPAAAGMPSVSFDWPTLVKDRRFWSFAAHFMLQKFAFGRQDHQCNRSILEYNMRCLDDREDDLIQGIDYGRFAQGTLSIDGTVAQMDSSGDVDLFCRQLIGSMRTAYGDRLDVVAGEEVETLHSRNGVICGATTKATDSSDRRLRTGDAFVVALGNASYPLCNAMGVACPVYPAKGHLVTVASEIDRSHNLTLHDDGGGGFGYAAPMAFRDNQGRRCYRLSGFVDFELHVDINHRRVNALVNACRKYLPDLEVVDASCCHRPVSADDRPLIGPTKVPNLFLCTGLGSRGWSIGCASGSILASQILDIEPEIDAAPFLPSRFRPSI